MLLIAHHSTYSTAQNKLTVVKGQVLEVLTRGDGKKITVTIPETSVSISDDADQTTKTNAEGNFELKLSKPIKKGEAFAIKAEKSGYYMIRDVSSVQKTSKIILINDIKLDPNALIIYLTKVPVGSGLTSSNTDDSRIALSGYITFQDEVLEDVNVKIKGVEDVYDNTNEQGFFEIYLPSANFKPQEIFTLVLQKDGKSEEIQFKDIRDFQTHPFISFHSYSPTVAQENKKNEMGLSKTKEEKSKANVETTKNQNIERNFRRFIDNLDKINLKGLSSDEIKILKDSLNHYADYISDISEQNQNLEQQSNEYVTLLEKTRDQQQKLMETEKELIRVELENQNKTNIIISMSAILMILSGWIYYYFYVNKKIRIQTEELNKRHRFIDFLLQELNHRVTNNLQVISSMLRRKIRRLPDENAKIALKEINKRVMDISAIHLGLYSQNDSRPINLKHYIRNITNTLEKLYAFEKKPIKVHIEVEGIEIAHKNAVFFGLIVNELVTNAMKYAFHEEENPELWIEVSKKNNTQYLMQVKDNGKGVPDDFDLEKAKSSGLKLVNLITQMLDGSFKMSNEQGSKFDMTLRLI